MKPSISRTEKKSRGRPRKDPISVHLTLIPEQAEPLDAWIAAQPDPKPSRPEAIRRLLQKALAAETPMRGLEERITEVKKRLAVPDVEKTATPAQGMEKLRRGLSENELRTLRQKRASNKPAKKPQDR